MFSRSLYVIDYCIIYRKQVSFITIISLFFNQGRKNLYYKTLRNIISRIYQWFWNSIFNYLLNLKNNNNKFKRVQHLENIEQFHDKTKLIKHSKNIEQFLEKRQNDFIQAFKLEDQEDIKNNQKVYCLSPQENILRIGLFQFKLDQITTELLQKILKFAKQKKMCFSEFINGLEFSLQFFINKQQQQQQAQKSLTFYKQVFSKIRTVLNSKIFFCMQLKKMVKQIKEINFRCLTQLSLDSTIDNYQFFSLIDLSKVKSFCLTVRGFRLKICQKIFLPELQYVNLGSGYISQTYYMKQKSPLNSKKNSNFFHFGFANCNDLQSLVKANEDLQKINIRRQNFDMMEKTIQMIRKKIKLQKQVPYPLAIKFNNRNKKHKRVQLRQVKSYCLSLNIN